MAYIANSGANNSPGGAATTIAVTLGAAVVAGNTIVGMAGWGTTTATISSVTDSLGNAYTIQTNKTDDNGNNQSGQTFFSKVTVGGTPVITVTFSVSVDFRHIIVGAWSGLDTASPADGTVGNFQSAPGTATDAVTSTSITTMVNGDTVIGFHQNTTETPPGAGTISAGTNYTMRNTANAILAMEDLTQASAGSIAATFTISNDHASITHICAFKPVAVSGLPLFSGLRSYEVSRRQELYHDKSYSLADYILLGIPEAFNPLPLLSGRYFNLEREQELLHIRDFLNSLSLSFTELPLPIQSGKSHESIRIIPPGLDKSFYWEYLQYIPTAPELLPFSSGRYSSIERSPEGQHHKDFFNSLLLSFTELPMPSSAGKHFEVSRSLNQFREESFVWNTIRPVIVEMLPLQAGREYRVIQILSRLRDKSEYLIDLSTLTFVPPPPTGGNKRIPWDSYIRRRGRRI